MEGARGFFVRGREFHPAYAFAVSLALPAVSQPAEGLETDLVQHPNTVSGLECSWFSLSFKTQPHESPSKRGARNAIKTQGNASSKPVTGSKQTNFQNIPPPFKKYQQKKYSSLFVDCGKNWLLI